MRITNKKAEELLAYLVWEGRPVGKKRLAAVLWPDSEPRKARDNLYKVCRYLGEFQNGAIPLVIRREAVWVETEAIDCDIRRFEEYYRSFPNVDCCLEAVALYKAPFLFEALYEWTQEAEAYYDIRYLECLELLAEHYDRNGNGRKADYYRKKLEQF